MRILLLTFYYSPDLSAGAFRATALVNALVAAGGGALEVDVLTTSPNRYRSFSAESPGEESSGNVRIRRVKLPAHDSGILDQSRAFAAFARQVLRAVRGERYDVVIATSSRLFTAYLGTLVARRVRAPLYLDIRDIFTDTVSDVFRGRWPRILLPVLERVERYAINSADTVNVVSEGFLPYFRERYPGVAYSVFTNGIDDEFVGKDFEGSLSDDNPRTVLYAGNIGEGQGLHCIIPELAERLGPGYEVVVVGDGGARAKLEKVVATKRVRNVRIEPPVPRETLFKMYRDADYLFLHLNAFRAFEKVLPSKIFEYAATGKPILAGVAGYAAEFVQKEVANSAVFAPGDVAGAISAFGELKHGHTERHQFIARFLRTTIMAEMAREILAIGRPGQGNPYSASACSR